MKDKKESPMKTSTLTIRISPEDKKVISDLAWKNRMSMAEYLLYLVRKAEKAEQRKLKGQQESKE